MPVPAPSDLVVRIVGVLRVSVSFLAAYYPTLSLHMVGSQHRMHDHVQRRLRATLLVGPGFRRECAGKRYAVTVIERLQRVLDGIVEGDHVHEQTLAVA